MVTELAICGMGVSVECDSESLHEMLRFDFAGFAPEPVIRARFIFRVHLCEPEVPACLEESFRGPNGVCFDRGEVRHIRYPGPIWLSYDYGADSALIQGLSLEKVYFHLYLAILSRLGERLDEHGLHRVHALGLRTPQGAGCLLLMPPGGGKSTLGVSALTLPGWRLLSEDTPLLDRRGFLHPFPFRVGLRDRDSAKGVPEELLRSQGSKLLVRADAYPLERDSVPCRFILAGAWTTAPEPRIERLSKSAALALLGRDCVVGLGLPQITELFVRIRPREVLGKARIALARLACAIGLVRRAQCYRIYLCPDRARNAQFLTSLQT